MLINTHFEIARAAHCEALRKKQITKRQFEHLMSIVFKTFKDLHDKGDNFAKEKQMWLPAFDLGCSTEYLEKLNVALKKCQESLDKKIQQNYIRKNKYISIEDYERSMRRVG